mgnify:CR=1 FL=1
MRTTLTLEDDLADKLKELAARRRMSFKEVLNDVIRRGISSQSTAKHPAKPFRVISFRSAFRPGIDPLRLNQLSDETGGRYYFNFINFLTPLQQLAKENSGYYLLSYQSPHPAGKTGFQKVEVKTVNPEFRVRTREGYQYGE